MLKALVCYRLIDPGREFRFHREWYVRSTMGDLLGEDYSLAQKDKPYRCLDLLLEHRDELLMHIGALKKEAGRDIGLVRIPLPNPQEPMNEHTFHFSLCRERLRRTLRREGRYLLRSNMQAASPETVWERICF
jgi:hypothetical protein